MTSGESTRSRARRLALVGREPAHAPSSGSEAKATSGQPVRHTGPPAALGHALWQQIADGHATLAQLYSRVASEEQQIQLASFGDQSVHADVNEIQAAAHPPKLLSVADLANFLAVDPRTVRRWRTSGELPPAVQLGGVVRWEIEDIEHWLERRKEGA